MTDPAPVLPGFDEFYRDTYSRVLAGARFLAANMVDAEQAVADGYAETAKRWDRVSGYEAREAYVRRIVRQRLAKARRRRGRRKHAETRGPVPPRATDPELSAQVRLVLDLIPLLPPRQRAAIALSAQELTSEEIAQELGMKASTVRTHLERARRRLRDALGIRPGTSGDRLDEFVPAGTGARSTRPRPGTEQPEPDPLARLLRRGDTELREALAADTARRERLRALIADQIARPRRWGR